MPDVNYLQFAAVSEPEPETSDGSGDQGSGGQAWPGRAPVDTQTQPA